LQEIVHTSEYANFLRHLFPAFRTILLRSPATHPADGVDVRFRHLVLEIMNRLPNNEVLRPYAPELLRIATETLSRDTEENALTCLRIIFDLHKNFRPALEGEVQCFLDLVQRIYRLLPTSINKAFFISLPDQRRLLSIFFLMYSHS
jgi:transformation/transcription domain-associated protein